MRRDIVVLMIVVCAITGWHGCRGDSTGASDPTPESITEPDVEPPTEAEPATESVEVEPPPAGPSEALAAAIERVPEDQRAYQLPVKVVAEAGKGYFESTCAFCHGTGGKGDGSATQALDPAPGDWTNPARFGLTTEGEKVWIILEGVGQGSAMPGYRASMSERQVRDLVAHLKVLAASPPPS